MNITMRKLAMLEQEMIKREEQANFDGYTSSPIDHDMKNKITKLMDRIRAL